ncbi:carboxyphosphonoenolpyruvate phosphonomutase-like protein [Cordyceps javanica]|uniref:Carboxyphosphonoenolpyruvate phosphonomutase-like protein n=1 Tax=Cordyceps javanica TaxID=43265 RepID=A0A545V1R6_9HYPO|nr:carboxyphosphonoenolpyruvate phosphonomutase-like protein [Cordyceps javanica]
MSSSPSSTTTNDFAKALKALHKPGRPLIVPNVWDAPSLYAVASLNDNGGGGEKRPVAAVATASWALAHARGAADEDLTAEQNLAADSIPAAGYGRGLEGSLYSKADAVARVRAALGAAAAAGVPDFVVNARCDVFRLDDAPGLDDATRMREALDRGRAYLAAGATTVFFWGGGARGLSTAEVRTLVAELGGRVAVLLTKRDGALSTAELADIGVARISVGPSLYLAAMNAVKTNAAQILGGGGLI